MRSVSLMVFILVSLSAGLDDAVRTPSTGTSTPANLRAGQQSPTAPPMPGIKVIFTCDKVKASMADSVVFDVAILNVGTDDAYVYDRLEWGEGGGLLLWFRDDRMGFFRPWVDPPWLPPRLDDPGLYVRLEPGRFYGLRQQWLVKNLGRGRPGSYTLWVEYEGPIFRKNVYDPKFSGRPMPECCFDFQNVKSNSVTFDAVP